MKSPSDTPLGTRAVAMTVAIAVHVIVLLVLLYTFLTYPPADMPEPEPLQPNPVTYVDPETIEYDFDPSVIDHIMAGEAVEEVSDEVYGDDIPQPTDGGEINQRSNDVSTPHESPVKVTEEPRESQAKSTEAYDRAASKWGKQTKGDPKQVKDQSKSLTITIANSASARSDKTGKIVFQVTVNGQGRVSGKPRFDRSRSEGEVAVDEAIKARCREEAARQTFAVIAGSPTQEGTVTFVFTDKK